MPARNGFGVMPYFSDYENRKNTALLIQNMIRTDIPTNILSEISIEKLTELLNKLRAGKNPMLMKNFVFYENSDLIKKVNISSKETPKYIYGPGVEPIIYYDYKNSGKYREMGIPNLMYYIAFVYNSIIVREELFNQVYRDDALNYSTSEIMNKDIQYYMSDYDEILYYEYDFKNTSSNHNINQRLQRDQLAEETYLYYLTTDIESYFSNIYSHNFNLIKNKEPFNISDELQKYLEFLDTFNMRINNNQTKGIVTGPQSSFISAEILGLYLDDKIKRIITDEEVNYIRHVDDMTFYSNDISLLERILKNVQTVLHQNRLTIKEEKTRIHKGFKDRVESNIYEIYEEFNYLDDELKYSEEYKVLSENDFYKLKKYIEIKINDNQYTQIKSLLSLLKKRLQSSKLTVSNNISIIFINYFLKLGYLNNILQLWIYKMLEVVVVENTWIREEIISIFKNNTKFINEMHHNTIAQIWHYHILNQLLDDAEEMQELNKLIDFYSKDNHAREVNPLVLIEFVKKDFENNENILDYILETYKRKDEDFETTVSYSKWWLVLITLRYVGKLDHKQLNKLFRTKNDGKIMERKLGIFEELFTY